MSKDLEKLASGFQEIGAEMARIAVANMEKDGSWAAIANAIKSTAKKAIPAAKKIALKAKDVVPKAAKKVWKNPYGRAATIGTGGIAGGYAIGKNIGGKNE